MRQRDESVVLERIQYIADRVYKNHKNALYMLINDLEEFFEINGDVNKMTSEEFDTYINNILN